MPKAKKKAKDKPIIGLGKNIDNLTVQKSTPLLTLFHSEMTLAEFKLLDTYLARIDSHNPDNRVVIIEKGELEKLLHVKKINIANLKVRLKHLLSNVIEIEDNETKKSVRMITLFESAFADQDDEGLWQIQLECTAKAMKYIFNIENIGYLRYKLKCVTSLKSRQAYILFLYLESNRFRSPFVVELDELKKILCCEKEATYRQYKRFNDLVLKRIHKEVNEKTECKFQYETVKKGRSVVAIRFRLDSKSNPDYELSEETPIVINQSNPEVWKQPLEQFELTDEQYDMIRSLLVTVPDDKLPQTPACAGSIDLMRYHYIDQKTNAIKERNQQKTIKNKYAYLVKMIKKDIAKG